MIKKVNIKKKKNFYFTKLEFFLQNCFIYFYLPIMAALLTLLNCFFLFHDRCDLPMKIKEISSTALLKESLSNIENKTKTQLPYDVSNVHVCFFFSQKEKKN